MATRTAAKAAPRQKPATAKRPAAKATVPPASPRKRTISTKAAAAQKPPAARKAAAKKAPAPKTSPVPRTPAKTTAPKATAARRTTARGAGRAKTSRAPKPKALEVSYSGRIFRSRLEARWAVFLDLLEVNWDYEPSFYQVGTELFYLPDFYLPDHQLWLEVKGAPFMDSESMAKCIAAVAGPMRIPLREPPYTPSDRLLLGGPFRALKHGLMPVHTLMTPAGPGKAAFSHAAFGTGPDGQASVNTLGGPWDTAPATGIEAARRPSPARLEQLLEPAPHLQAGRHHPGKDRPCLPQRLPAGL